jgi:hypothetical protein
MTSVARELGADAPTLDAVAKMVAASFGTVFTRSPDVLDPESLSAMLPPPLE